MSEDQFLRLFKYVEDFRKEVNQKLDEKASQSSVDTVIALAKRIEDVEIEQASGFRQLDRLPEWSRRASTKIGIAAPEI